MIRFVVFLLLALLLSAPAQADDYKSAFDRVMATNTIRCGYILYSPWMMKDTATGVLSGMTYDVINRLGQALSLKVEWVEEVGSASMFQGLETKRYDVICTPMWATGARARMSALTHPLFYGVINAYARADDHRFDADLSAANRSDVTIAVLDGSTSSFIAAEDFPLAKAVSLPELTDFSQLLVEVQTGKADLTFAEASKFTGYSQNNPGLLRNVTADKPARLSAYAFAVQADEHRLLATVNTALDELQNAGHINRIISAYEPAPGTWRRVAQPFQ